jgi:hypothetical protein
MPMDTRSILTGKCYRTPEGEMRQVTAIELDKVTYSSISATHGPGMLTRLAHKSLPLERFASEVEYEVTNP